LPSRSSVGDSCGFAACLGTDEEVVFAAEGDGAHAAFGRVVVEFQDAVVEVGTQARRVTSVKLV